MVRGQVAVAIMAVTVILSGCATSPLRTTREPKRPAEFPVSSPATEAFSRVPLDLPLALESAGARLEPAGVCQSTNGTSTSVSMWVSDAGRSPARDVFVVLASAIAQTGCRSAQLHVQSVRSDGTVNHRGFLWDGSTLVVTAGRRSRPGATGVGTEVGRIDSVSPARIAAIADGREPPPRLP